jgi:hypothetical protein
MMLLPLLITAISITPTTIPATPTPETSSEIQKIRDVVQQKVKEKLQLITQPTLTKKGLIGKIVQIENQSLTIDYQSNLTVISLDSDLVIIDQNRNKTKFENLKIGQDILVLGNQESETKFVAKRIVVSDLKLIENKPIVIIGKIVDISKTSPIFSLIPTKSKNTQYQIKTDSKSELIDIQNNKIVQTNLKSGNKIIVILIPDPKMTKTYYAQKIINLDYLPDPTPTPKK